MKTILLSLALSFSIVAYSQSPWLIKDINSTNPTNQLSDGTFIGENNSTLGSNLNDNDEAPTKMYPFNGIALFFANDGKGGRGLYRTDGTNLGTTLISTLGIAASSSVFIPNDTYSTGSLFFFEVNNPDSLFLFSLWRSDGTTAGTFPIFTGATKDVLYLPYFGKVVSQAGDMFYFVASEENATEDTVYESIYKTDGTVAGTSLYFHIGKWPGDFKTNDDIPYAEPFDINLIAFNNKIYFNLNSQIFYSDGTNPPRQLPLASGNTNEYINEWVNVNNQYLIITASGSQNAYQKGVTQLQRLYPTDTAPVILKDSISFEFYLQSSTGPAIIGNKVFYIKNQNSLGVTNGEISGTFDLASNYQPPPDYISLNNSGIIYEGDSSFNSKIFIWDGNSSSSYKTLTVITDSVNNYSGEVNNIVSFGDTLLVFAGNLFQADVNNTYCYKVGRISLTNPYGSPDGVMLNNSYIGFGDDPDAGVFEAGIEPLKIIPFRKLWTGAVSTDWNTAGNWLYGSVPTTTDDIAIPPVKNYPVISATASCRNLTVYYSTLTVNNSANLNVYGYVANYGAFINRSIINGNESGNITGPGSLTRIGSYSNKTYGDGDYNIDSININGADLDLTSMNNYVNLNSIINFKSDNKLIMNYTDFYMGKIPFFTGYNSKRFVVNNRIQALQASGTTGSLTSPPIYLNESANSMLTFPIGSDTSSYTPLSFTPSYPGYPRYADVYMLDSTSYFGDNKPFMGAVNKTWKVAFAAGQYDTIRLGWNASAEGKTFNRNACIIAYYNGTNWVLGNTQKAVLSNGTYSISDYFLSFTGTGDAYGGFYPFIVASTTSALPIILLDFTGHLQNNNAILTWQTATEINSDHFNIERSTDGLAFTSIGKVNASGNSTLTQNYQYTDLLSGLTGLPSILYYRLKEVDKDGNGVYSKTIMLKLQKNGWNFIITPNPVSNILNVQLNNMAAGALINIVSLSGQKIQTRQINTSNLTLKIDVSPLSKGVYILQVQNNGETKEEKFIKE